MASQDLTEGRRRAVMDRTQGATRSGSIGLVLLVAIVLVGAATGLMLIGRAQAGPYILALLAVLAMIGVFLLFALAAGIIQASGKEASNPLIKSVVDGAVDGADVGDVEFAFEGRFFEFCYALK